LNTPAELKEMAGLLRPEPGIMSSTYQAWIRTWETLPRDRESATCFLTRSRVSARVRVAGSATTVRLLAAAGSSALPGLTGAQISHPRTIRVVVMVLVLIIGPPCFGFNFEGIMAERQS